MKKRPAFKSANTTVAPARPVSEVIECCQHIATLAGLLEQCGQISLAEPMEPRLIANAGGMIAAESRAVEEFLHHLELIGEKP